MTESATAYVTPAEAARLLDVSQSTVTRWAREGYITGIRRSPSRHGKGRIRIPRTEIARLLDDGTETAA